MARSHPPTLLTLVRRTLARETPLAPGQRILLGVSGGGDSMALLHALASLRSSCHFELVALGIDHGLRQQAPSELELAGQLAARLQVDFAVTRVRLEAGGNLQARARALRYQALEAAKAQQRADWIATAHHQADRAETVLLRLLRGASPRGLAVLPPVSGDRLRPMIRADKRTIEDHLRRHRLAFASDPSNRDRRFLRTRVREELLPLLEQLSPGIVTHLTSLADVLHAQNPTPEAILRSLSEAGDEVMGIPRLGRAQRAQLATIVRSGSTRGSVRLSASCEIRLDPRTRRPQVFSVPRS